MRHLRVPLRLSTANHYVWNITTPRKEKVLEPLSPREIQARVRAGADPAVVAAENGWPIDKVMRYAGPPLAEREYIVTQALNTELRRTGTAVSFADSVALVVAPTGFSPDDIAWDSFRREDGKWIVTAQLARWKHGEKAVFTYDHSGRNLHALDDVARRLLGVAPVGEMDFITETPIGVIIEEAGIEVVEEQRPRLVAVPALEVDIEETFVVESLDTHEVIAETVHAHQSETLMLPIQTQDPVVAQKSSVKKPVKAKGRRASIPTWDEILFGTSKNEDA